MLDAFVKELTRKDGKNCRRRLQKNNSKHQMNSSTAANNNISTTLLEFLMTVVFLFSCVLCFPFRFFIQLTSQAGHMSCDFSRAGLPEVTSTSSCFVVVKKTFNKFSETLIENFNKTIPVALVGYEMVIANARSRNNCQIP